jgi:rubrerythrin
VEIEEMSTKSIVTTRSFNYPPTPKYYTEEAVDKLLIGVHMLGGAVCPTCGTVHLRSTKCPVCSTKKYL